MPSALTATSRAAVALAEHGLDDLREEIARQGGRDVGSMVPAVVRALADRDHPDDVWLLGARRAPFREGLPQA